jgi:hypothetical protein
VTKGELPGWRGKPSSQAPYMYAAGNVVVTTDASGMATISFGRTFPAPPVVVAMGGNAESVTMGYAADRLTNTTFSVYFFNQAGTALSNAGVRCLWQAFPAT